MRYIDLQLIGENLPVNWDQQARLAETAVAGAEPQGRSAVVNRHSYLWQNLKDTLKRASHNKCWYCESVDIRADNAVDHFRPKNAVAECSGHEGYWWLAFRWDNYRYCCTFCNCHRIDLATGPVSGKAHHFPLQNEDRRASTPADDLTREEPLLLDPCVPADPGLLWFDETGQAVPNPICGNEDRAYPRQRVTTSIAVYHLNQRDLVEQRMELCSEIRRKVEDADRFFTRYIVGDDATARIAFEHAIRDLHAYLAANSRYSSTGRAMMMGLRGEHPVVDVVLLAL